MKLWRALGRREREAFLIWGAVTFGTALLPPVVHGLFLVRPGLSTPTNGWELAPDAYTFAFILAIGVSLGEAQRLPAERRSVAFLVVFSLLAAVDIVQYALMLPLGSGQVAVLSPLQVAILIVFIAISIVGSVYAALSAAART
jgi:hypothetical protein